MWGYGSPIPFFVPWLGGYQAPYGLPASSNWQWVTGETWSYTNWYPDQPDHCTGYGYHEDRLQFLGFSATVEPGTTWTGQVTRHRR